MIPLTLKKLVPFYSARWRSRYRALRETIAAHIGDFAFGQEGDVPWLDDRRSGLRFFGFWTEPKNDELYELIGSALPSAMPRRHFRLVKDYATRFLYPHMRPDLRPEGYAVDELWGFHGQHKDAIADQPDALLRERLLAAFRPKADDIIIDGGAFIGMGDLRLASDLTQGRIIAVEANPACHALLERNVAFNGARAANILPLHRALWNAPGTLELEVGDAQANTLVEEVAKGHRKQAVPTATVDDIVAEQGLERVTMLSLTLNGAEVEALDGAARTLREHRPRIRLAGWYSRGGTPIWRLTKDQLERDGYDVFVGPRGNVMALPKA